MRRKARREKLGEVGKEKLGETRLEKQKPVEERRGEGVDRCTKFMGNVPSIIRTQFSAPDCRNSA